MKFSAATIFATALYASNALATTTVKFLLESGDESINNHGLITKTGTSDIDFVYVGDINSTATFTYDGISKAMYFDGGEYEYTLSIWDHYVQVANDSRPDIIGISEGGYLTVNGSCDGFYGCFDVYEPNAYSQKAPAIMYKPKNSIDCTALRIKTQ